MPEYVPVKGFKEMENLLKVHDKKTEPIYIYFYGEKDNQGRSWCIDCVEAEETIMTAFRNNAPADCLILVVDVGNRAFWMDKENSFRSPPFSVEGIPALLHWKGVERLDGDQLRKPNLLELFFEETGTQKSSGLAAQ
ncbi:thioredoxin domain-containing protein 17 [Drosophila kikkawai]|uniref:Thioredoxin domain-containing protein 17 n=1 Tax=Drosophila kikkawai TaxID=30033 RepID=A0A6P4HQ49_DROKI|nr:thioredoxin domain-containing protein 17 [Drosophila kikkawai]